MGSNMNVPAQSESKLQTAGKLLKLAAKEWWNDDTFRLAASLAFYTIFSLAPVLLIAVGVASLFLAQETATEKIVAEVQAMVGAQGANAVREVIAASAGLGKSISAIVVGAVTFFLGASVVFVELQSALNKIWDVAPSPGRGVIARLILDRLRSFTIALGVGFLLIVSLVVNAAITALESSLDAWIPGVPWLWQIVNLLASFVVVAVLFAMIYKYLPDAKIAWRDVWIGAAVTSVLFNFGKHLIGLYLGQTAAASAFGAAGSFAVLLLWVYYSALVSFFGAEFTQVFARHCGWRIRPEEHAERVGDKPDGV